MFDVFPEDFQRTAARHVITVCGLSFLVPCAALWALVSGSGFAWSSCAACVVYDVLLVVRIIREDMPALTRSARELENAEITCHLRDIGLWDQYDEARARPVGKL
jgi:hypothetical protein